MEITDIGKNKKRVGIHTDITFEITANGEDVNATSSQQREDKGGIFFLVSNYEFFLKLQKMPVCPYLRDEIALVINLANPTIPSSSGIPTFQLKENLMIQIMPEVVVIPIILSILHTIWEMQMMTELAVYQYIAPPMAGPTMCQCGPQKELPTVSIISPIMCKANPHGSPVIA